MEERAQGRERGLNAAEPCGCVPVSRRAEGVDLLLRNARRIGIGFVIPVMVMAALGAALVGCAGSTEEPAQSSAAVAASAPTPVPKTAPPTPAPKAAPPTAASGAAPTVEPSPTPYPTPAPVATRPPVVVEMQPRSDLPTDQQIAKLSELVQGHLTGMNNIERPRLNIPPDVRDDSRRGGIVVNIELNGDEYTSIVQRKEELDKLMRDTYHVLYASGYQLVEATISAVMMGKSHRRKSIQAPVTVYKTRLKQAAAEGIDWDDKEDLDFNEIWDTLLLSPTWKSELKEAQGGG